MAVWCVRPIRRGAGAGWKGISHGLHSARRTGIPAVALSWLGRSTQIDLDLSTSSRALATLDAPLLHRHNCRRMTFLSTTETRRDELASLPTISLVIPCWNDAEALRRLLP